MRKGIILLVLLTNFLMANNYVVKYGDTEVGYIENLDTIKDNYIKIKVDNFFMRMKNAGKDYLIIYKGDKPVKKEIDENCNFQLDKEEYITLIKDSLNKNGISKRNKVELKVKDRIVKYFKDIKNNISIHLNKVDTSDLEVSTKTFWDSI